LLPHAWERGDFWSGFEKIYLGLSNTKSGDQRAVKIAQTAACETLRLRPPLNFGKSWTEFWQNGGTAKEFYRILSDASLIGTTISSASDTGGSSSPGRFGYKPVDLATAFSNGHLYYPVRTLVNSQDDINSPLSSRTETVVVRSDRTIHTVKEEPTPRGTPPEDRILRLTDGTLIESPPKASVYSTWSWRSIEAYQQKRSKSRPLKMILRDVKGFLQSAVWLPFAYDYDLLTLLVPVTFAQAVFQAVPMALVVGPPGSGKSALGRAMCQICANAVPVGQISAAAAARLIHETKGFILLDDLESIGKRPKNERPQLNELIQALKVSYNKDTSWKIWINVSRGMRQERLNFFGVKMINNTSGADDILGSRMLKIHARKIPLELKSKIGSQNAVMSGNLDSLRDELHTWTFENVALIDQTYKRLYPQSLDRAAEIAAPLKVFAEIAESEDLLAGLETALKVKNEGFQEPDDPIETLIRAVKNLVRSGFRQLSTTHVVLEMKAMNSQYVSEIYKFEPAKWENPAWVGRHLRTYNLVEINAKSSRQWLFGKSLRIYPIKTKVLEEVALENPNISLLDNKPLDFCQDCASCSYRLIGCPIMPQRLSTQNNH